MTNQFVVRPGVCPRCLAEIVGHPAISRTDNENTINICSACGTEEAFEHAAGNLRPQNKWPISRQQREARSNRRSWDQQRQTTPPPIAPLPLVRELPTLRTYLLNRWRPGEVFERSLLGSLPGPTALALAVGDAQLERQALLAASLWWVKEDMLTLVAGAAPTIPGDLYAREVKLPGEQRHGLVVFEQPWIGLDARQEGKKAHVHALVWNVAALNAVPCIILSMYAYFDFDAGMSGDQLQNAIKSGMLYEGQLQGLGGGSHALHGGFWSYIGRTSWPMDLQVSDFEWPRALEGKEYPPPDSAIQHASQEEDRRFFASFAALVNHKLSSLESHRIPRFQQKQMARETKSGDPDREPNTIRLVRLREVIQHRTREDDAEHKHVNWTHRFPVSGHYAWRRCGPGRVDRRIVFIPAYIKGDPSLPLVIKSKVNVWVR